MKIRLTRTLLHLACLTVLSTGLLAACASTTTATPQPSATRSATTPPAIPPAPPTELPAVLPEGALAIGGKGQLQNLAVSPPGFVAVANPFGVAVYKAPEFSVVWAKSIPNGVLALAYSPDGKKLAGATQDTLLLWDAASSQEINHAALQVDGQTLVIRGLSFSPDGNLLAGKDAMGNLLTWDLQSSTVTLSVNSPLAGGADSQNTGFATQVAFSPDSSALLFSQGQNLILWDRAKSAAIWTYTDKKSDGPLPSTHYGFSPDGKTVFAAFDDGVRLINASNGKQIKTLPGSQQMVDAAYTSNGETLLGASSTQITTWDPAGKKQAVLPVENVQKIFFLDGQTGLAVKRSGNITLFNLADGKETAALSGYYTILDAQYLSDGSTLALETPGTIVLWDTAANKAAREIPALAISPDGCKIFQFRFVDGNKVLALQDIAQDKTLGEWPAAPGFEIGDLRAVFSPDGKQMAKITDKVDFYGVDNGKVIRTQKAPKNMAGSRPAYSPDGKLLVIGTQDKTYALFDAVQMRPLKTISMKEDVGDLAFSPDGQMLAVSSGDTVQLVEPLTGNVLTALTALGSLQRSPVFSPDGKTLVSADSANHALWFWDVPSGQFRGGISTPAVSLSFSPDGKKLAVAPGNGTVLFYDPAAPHPIKTLPAGH